MEGMLKVMLAGHEEKCAKRIKQAKAKLHPEKTEKEKWSVQNYAESDLISRLTNV